MGKALSACALAAIMVGGSLETARASDTPAGPGAAPAANSVTGAQIVQTALKYLGYRYTTVGNSPSTGFSCIGFVSYVYQSNGILLPGDLADAQAYAPAVAWNDLLPGDILYFQNTVWPGISHAAIYLGSGRFVHAEWYNRGVVISTFENDPIDGSYWIGKYLGANRPWGGAPGTVSAPPPGGATPTATATPVAMLSGTSAMVSVRGVNLRSGPAKTYTIETVLKQGTKVTVVGKSAGWDRVQLGNGTIGWVVSWALNDGAVPASLPVQPAPQGTAAVYPTAVVSVDALNLRAGPSLGATIIIVLRRGQRVEVIGQTAGWDQVRLPDGRTGWVSRPLLGTITPPPAAPRSGEVTVPLRVHAGPSLTARVLTVLPAGSHITILQSQTGWDHIRLSSGTTGYVASRYVRYA